MSNLTFAADDVDDATELTEDQTAEIAEEPVMEDADGQLLRHAVFFSFNEESTEQDIASVTTAFAALPEKIDSIIDFQWGTNNSPENHDDGFTHGFLLTFKDEAGAVINLGRVQRAKISCCPRAFA